MENLVQSSLTDNPHLLVSTNGASGCPSPTSALTSPTFRPQYRFEAQPGVGSYDVFVTHRGSAASTGITLRAMSSTPLRIVDGPQPLPYATTVSHASHRGSLPPF